MKLTIKNFARIKESEIKIDGITIIAGENNTGKTTVGKVLFSCFNSLNNIEEEISSDKEYSVQKEIFNLYHLLLKYIILKPKNMISIDGAFNGISDNLYSDYIKSKKSIYDILIDYLKEYVNIKDKNVIDLIKKLLKK